MDYLLKEIGVFVKIIDLGSFRAAAEDLHLTQSALTQRLKKLEGALGVRLIDRTTRTVAPTVVGQSFLPVARRMLMQIEQSMGDLRDLIDARTGQVTIASLISVATYVLPDALRRFADVHPNVSVRVFDDAEQEIVAHVRRGEAEFGIDMRTASVDPDIEITPLLEDRYVLVFHADHPLAADGPVAWEELAEMPLVTLGSRSGTNQLILSRIAKSPRSGTWRYEVQHLSTLLGVVQAGLGVGIVPAMAMRGRTPGPLVQRPITAPEFARTIVLVQRSGVALSPAGERLKGCLVETFERLARQG